MRSVALGEIATIKGGGTPSKSNPDFWGGDIPWISPKDMKQWNISDAEDKITFSALEKSATNLIPSGSVLVVNRSGILKHTLPVGLTERAVAINQDIKAFLFGKETCSSYIAHIIKAAEPIVLTWVRATTADNFPIENLSKLQVPYPMFAEQQRIAAILDKADALRRKRKRALELIDSMIQSTFLDIFGDLLEAGTYRRGPISDWVADFETGKNMAPDPDATTANGFRVLKVSAVTSGRFEPSESKPLPAGYEPPKSHLVRRGDLLFSRANTEDLIGAVAHVDRTSDRLALPDKIWRFRWRAGNEPHPLFIHALFSTLAFRREVSKRATGTSGSMKNISKEKVLSIQVGQPSRALQDTFAERKVAVIAAQQHAMRQNAMMESMFASLQHRAFTGQL